MRRAGKKISKEQKRKWKCVGIKIKKCKQIKKKIENQGKNLKENYDYWKEWKQIPEMRWTEKNENGRIRNSAKWKRMNQRKKDNKWQKIRRNKWKVMLN